MTALSIILEGSLGTYDGLVEKIGLWLDRDDLNDRIPDFLALAEARFNRELRVLNQETVVEFATANPNYGCPVDFRRLKRIWISDSPNRPLSQIAGGVAAENYSGEPRRPHTFYLDNRVIYFMPPPDANYTFVMTYLARIMPLTADNETNWLLDENPDLYLMAALLEAAVYIRDQDAVAYLSPRVTDTIISLNLASRRDSWGVGPIVPLGPQQTRGGRC